MSVTLRADDLFSKLIRARGRCERCGTTRDLQCAHIRKRRFLNTRWLEENARCLCFRCHVWAHDCEDEFYDWVGRDLYHELYLISQRLDKVDIAAVLTRLNARLREVA